MGLAVAGPGLPRSGSRTHALALTVEQSYRGQGWGRAILAALEDLEVARGCNELWLRVFAWNLPARRLYESHGYELANQFTSDVHLRKRLERP